MDVRRIRTEEDHRAALAEIEALWDAEPRSPEDDRLGVLATVVNAYEEERFPDRLRTSKAPRRA